MRWFSLERSLSLSSPRAVCVVESHTAARACACARARARRAMRMRRNIWGAVPLAPLRQHVAVAAFRAWSRSAAQPSRRVVSSSRSRGAWRAVSRCRARGGPLALPAHLPVPVLPPPHDDARVSLARARALPARGRSRVFRLIVIVVLTVTVAYSSRIARAIAIVVS